MTHRALFEYDAQTDRHTYLLFNDRGEIVGFETEQKIDDIITENDKFRAMNEGRKYDTYKPTMSIPLTLYEKLGMREAIKQKDKKFIAKIANSSDYAKLRTSDGKL